MIDKTKPMTLGDIFSNTFTLIGKTIKRNLIIAAIFIIPAGLLFGWGAKIFYSHLAEALQNVHQNGPDTKANTAFIFSMMKGVGVYLFSVLLLIFGHIGALIGITKVTGEEIEGNSFSIGSAFEKIFSVTLLRVIGLGLLMMLVMFGFSFAFMIIIVITAAVNSWIFKFIMVFAAICAVLFIIYVIFKWYFAFFNIVLTKDGVIDSIKKSSSLIKDYWWRTFGIILLISILTAFAVTLISTPVSFLLMWDVVSPYFDNFFNNDPSAQIEAFKSIGIGYGLTIAFSSLLQLISLPVAYIVVYYDLKARKNDYPAPPAEENSGEDYTRSWDMPVE